MSYKDKFIEMATIKIFVGVQSIRFQKNKRKRNLHTEKLVTTRVAITARVVKIHVVNE